jgi:hypothetical protein
MVETRSLVGHDDLVDQREADLRAGDLDGGPQRGHVHRREVLLLDEQPLDGRGPAQQPGPDLSDEKDPSTRLDRHDGAIGESQGGAVLRDIPKRCCTWCGCDWRRSKVRLMLTKSQEGH